MSQKSDLVLTTTVGSEPSEFATHDARVMTLRWVYPPGDQVTVLSSETVVLGRDPRATTRLDSSQVSRRHAEVRPSERGPVVHDLESRNGVFVNALRVQSAPLRAGDVLRLGDCVAVVEVVGPEGLAGFGELAPGLFGGAALRGVLKLAKRAATAGLNVVLQGETGTGKERFARALHGFSGRQGPFLAVNCAAYAESTISAELFGYRRGAFTGAERASPGHVRAAHGGTLLLDEVLDLPFDLQAKLLRAIEQREVLPLGESEPVKVDVSFVAATQVPLAQAVQIGRFRPDLRARLEGFVLQIPPLRARRADVVPLFLTLLEQHGLRAPRLQPALVERLCLHDWPMNVRELENGARRLIATFDHERELRLEDASSWLEADRGPEAPLAASAAPRRRSSSAYETDELEALKLSLERHGGNLTHAATELGITRAKAYRMLRTLKP
ncbi:MAG TPA: sigma 54-interacting transcriptional regulator [Polyangiaceae bacterium]|jgi:transcriptional regulator with AAA-type ATPase domain|nr:sigma 54-interacting transcriptional regulator [Polyangiaceae bacterium]